MLSAEGLAEQVAQYNPKSNSKLIMQAYAYGRMKHEGKSIGLDGTQSDWAIVHTRVFDD